MTEGERFMAEMPIGQMFWTTIAPDGINGTPVESRIVERRESWGLRYVRVQTKVGEYTVIHAANWWGRLRMMWEARRDNFRWARSV